MTESKKCTKCNIEKPATREYFYTSKAGASGLHPHCKDCFKAAVYARRKGNPDRAKEIRQQSYAKNRESSKARLREQHKKRMADPIAAEKERARCREKARRERASKPEVVRERLGRYRSLNREALRTKDCDAKARAYAKAPEVFRARTAQQRAARAEAPGEFTGLDLLAAFQRQRGACYYCSNKVGGRHGPWHADHFIPLSRGGTNEPGNIVIACAGCNLRKHNKMPHEFMPERFPAPQ